MEMRNYDDEAAVGFLRRALDEKYKRACDVSPGGFKDLVKVVKKVLRLSGRPILIGYNSFNHAGLFDKVKPAYLWGTERLYFEAPKQMSDPYNWQVKMYVTLYTSAFPLSQFPNADKEMPHSIFIGDRGIFIQIYYYEPVDYLDNGLIFFNKSSLEVQTDQFLLDKTSHTFYSRKSKNIKRHYLEQEEIEGFKQFLLYFLKKSEKMITDKI